MKILLTGSGGFVGHKIMEMCDRRLGRIIASPSLRGADPETVRRIVEESEADVILHTAAISDIGQCQADPAASYHANVLIPLYLAEASKDRKLVCFSSDQVYSACFDPGPYSEDNVRPGNIYAEHKLEMEKRVLDLLPSAVMLRAEWMYDLYDKRSNYLMNILNAQDRIAFSSGQFRGITYLREVAESMEKVVSLPGGAYNFGSETTMSMYEITRRFTEYLGKKITVEDAPARHNLWMDCSKARRYGIDFSDVLVGLIKCAEDYHLREE
ncbi:MAG: sugar nucleotide-binding protein [Firmicutes bacterium]|nr:sugar nucleotide-binding protein [Bacillota bacterium]